jgi:serine/arginine repetitive matrix protein 2
MILETLNRIRSKNTVGKKKFGSEVEEEGDGSAGGIGGTISGYQALPSQPSTRTSSATTGPSSTPPSSRSAKRYSNNLFGSGRSRDFTVVRSLTTRASRSTTGSITGTEGSSTFSDRPITPDSGATSSAQSTPEKASLGRSASLAAPGPYGGQSSLTSMAEYRLSKTLGPSGFKRASLAFEDAIKAMTSIGEEAEEEILMPRTPYRAPSRSPNHTVCHRLFNHLTEMSHNFHSLSCLSPTLDNRPLRLKQAPQYHQINILQERWNLNVGLRYRRAVLGLFLQLRGYQVIFPACHGP